MVVTRAPWGEFRTLLHYGALTGNAVKVKELIIRPGEKTSYQYHAKRSEILIPLNSGLNISCSYDQFPVSPFETITLSPHEEHQLINSSDKNLVILEVQFGTATEESDIVRLDDPHQSVRKEYFDAPNSQSGRI